MNKRQSNNFLAKICQRTHFSRICPAGVNDVTETDKDAQPLWPNSFTKGQAKDSIIA